MLIGLLARYHPMKDHANFLRAASLLLKDHPQTHFVLSGDGVDHNNEGLREMVSKLSIAERVHLLGERSDMSRIAAALDIAALSSAYGEGFPNVIGETMACAVPCVVTDLGDSAFVVGETGRVVQPRDACALANALSELIEMGESLGASWGRQRAVASLENFSIKAITGQYESLYSRWPRHLKKERRDNVRYSRVR